MLSVVTDYGRKTWPVPDIYQATPPLPIVIEKPVEHIPTQEEWDEFLEVCEKAKKYDEMMGEPDCVDPGKDAWMEEIERRLSDLEKPQAVLKLTTLGTAPARARHPFVGVVGNVDPAGGHSINY